MNGGTPKIGQSPERRGAWSRVRSLVSQSTRRGLLPQPFAGPDTSPVPYPAPRAPIPRVRRSCRGNRIACTLYRQPGLGKTLDGFTCVRGTQKNAPGLSADTLAGIGMANRGLCETGSLARLIGDVVPRRHVRHLKRQRVVGLARQRDLHPPDHLLAERVCVRRLRRWLRFQRERAVIR